MTQGIYARTKIKDYISIAFGGTLSCVFQSVPKLPPCEEVTLWCLFWFF